ncbi:MAG: ATP synthase F1 subunit gamma [bacterium]|nr:ATP synthase F1 subunit gamma [bacterium]
MENIRDIKSRIKSVREIHKITRAMKMVATAKYKKIQKKLERTKQYLSELEGMMSLLKKEVVLRYNPLCNQVQNAGKDLILIVTSDRGLCGAFNTNLIRFGNTHLQNADLYVIGKKGINILKRRSDISIIGKKQDVFTHPGFKIYSQIAETIKFHYLSGNYSSIKALYTGFESMGQQPLRLIQLLPLTDIFSDAGKENKISGDIPETESGKPAPKARRVSALLEPEPEHVFSTLANHYIDLRIQHIMEESFLAEQITRMNAMDAATTNAEELINNLLLVYNRARQAVITTEILEIVGGAEALKK